VANARERAKQRERQPSWGAIEGGSKNGYRSSFRRRTPRCVSLVLALVKGIYPHAKLAKFCKTALCTGAFRGAHFPGRYHSYPPTGCHSNPREFVARPAGLTRRVFNAMTNRSQSEYHSLSGRPRQQTQSRPRRLHRPGKSFLQYLSRNPVRWC
jgi:hypothetical protein